VIGVDASNWQGLAAGWVRNCGEPNTGLNHGVAVVGWVDNVKMTNGQTWDYWIIKNRCVLLGGAAPM
jgi:C1A family cysteine protease